jgi:hypothetical protein
MTKPSKPRTGPKRQATRRTLAPPKPAEGPNGDARTPSGVPPAGATAGGETERGAIGLFARTRAVALNTPDFRPEVVERTRRLIAEGRYRSDPEAIADRMIREGLLEDLKK